MIKTTVNISRNDFGEVFIQTSMITKSNIFKYISDCQVTMSEEDCIDLAIALSYIHTYTEYEDADCFVTRYIDGEIDKEYQNE